MNSGTFPWSDWPHLPVVREETLVVPHPCGSGRADSEPKDPGAHPGTRGAQASRLCRPSASSGRRFKLNPACAMQGLRGDDAGPEPFSNPLST